MQTLRLGSTGDLVTKWQQFLRGQGYLLNANGTFDDSTNSATIKFQGKYKLDADGIVGNQTFGKAAMLGFEIVEFASTETGYPPKPDFAPLTNNAAREEKFGRFEFVPAPTAKDPETIKITNDWAKQNIIRIVIPQLAGIEGASEDGHVWFHKKGEKQLLELWKRWQQEGLLENVLTYAGAYNPRFVRGHAHEQLLSNHAFGTAFDINAAWNKLGAEPATSGAKGCVYPLVKIANQCGFYWGGHFVRKDGMHFELAQIQP